MIPKVELPHAHSLGCMCANIHIQGGAEEREGARDGGGRERIKRGQKKKKTKPKNLKFSLHTDQ